METDWRNCWRRNYGTLPYKIYLRIIDTIYNHLLGNTKLRGPSTLELGAGSGVHSLRMAKRFPGCKVTLVDNNAIAIEISNNLYANSNSKVEVQHLNTDVLDLDLHEKFDIVHSEGLIEHFYGEDRGMVFAKHAQCCKPTGIIIIVVPQKCVQHCVARWIMEKTHTWLWDEKPFSRQEIYELNKRFRFTMVKEYSPLVGYQIGVLLTHTRHQ